MKHHLRYLSMALLATSIMLIAGCKGKSPNHSADMTGFTIEGTAEEFADGTKLLLTNGDGFPIDSFTVTGHHFSYKGQSAGVQQYVIYEVGNELNSVEFFTEEGTICIELNKKPGTSRISGTVANDAWQELNDVTWPYYEKMQQIEDSISGNEELSDAAQWSMTERYYQLFSVINKKVIEAAEKNADNELGYFLVVGYKADNEEVNDQMRNIIAKMPDAFRQRPPMQALEMKLKEMEATEVGKQMPDFTLPTSENNQLSVLDEVKKHRVTVLDFWASWCGPCRQTMPLMRQLYACFKDNGLGIIGISLDEDGEAWRAAINDMQLEWPQVSDLKGWQAAPAQLFHVNAIPYVVLVDSSGTIIQKNISGEKLWQVVEHQLQ